MCDTETHTCDPCRFRGGESSSVKYCKTCQEKLCKDCADVHKSSKATRGHFLVNIKDMSVNSITGNEVENLQKCLYHPEKLVEFFCTEHNHLICSKCILLDQSRNCTKVIEVASAGEALLRSTFTETVRTDLQSVKLKLERDAQSIKLQQAATKKAHTDIKEMLSKTREKLFQRYHKLESDILSKVQSDEINENKKLESLHERINEILKRLNDASSVFESANENGSGSDIFRCILLIGNYLEECEARLDMKKSTIGICNHSLKLSASLHFLLNENIHMIERSERHYQFFISQFPSLQISFSEFLKIISRGNLCSDSEIIDGHIENTASDQFKEHDSNSDYQFDPNVVRLSGEDQNRTMCDMRNKQHTNEFLQTNHVSASHNPVMMNNSAVRPVQPPFHLLLLPYQPPVSPSIRPFLDMGMQPYPPPFTRFSLQYIPPTVPTYTQNYYTGERCVNFNKETLAQNKTQRSPQTERRTGHIGNAQTDHSNDDKTEETFHVLSEETDLQHLVTEKTFMKPCTEHMASSNDADMEELEISIQHQKKHINKETNLPRSKLRGRKRGANHTEESPKQNIVNIPCPNSNAIDKETVELLNISVEHSGKIKTTTATVQDSATENTLEIGVNTSGIQNAVHLEERVDSSNDRTLNVKSLDDRKELKVDHSETGVHLDLEREHEVTDMQNCEKCERIQNMQTIPGNDCGSPLLPVCEEQIDITKPHGNGDTHLPQNEQLSTEVEHCTEKNDKNTLNSSECSYNVEQLTNDSIYVRDPTRHPIQMVSERNEFVFNECREYAREPVRKVVIDLSEPTSQLIPTESDRSDSVLDICHECTTERVDGQFISLAESTSQIVRTECDKTDSAINESRECEKGQLEKESHPHYSVLGKLQEYTRKPDESELICLQDSIIQMECDENDSVVKLIKPVEKGLINIAETNTQMIPTDGDKEDAVLSECHECAKEPLEKELIHLTEPTSQTIETNSRTIITECKDFERGPAKQEMSNASEPFAKSIAIGNQMTKTKTEKCDSGSRSTLLKQEMTECGKHVKGDVATVSDESDLLHISKEYDTGQDENISDRANISLASQTKYHVTNRLSIHTDNKQYTDEHSNRRFLKHTDVKRNTQLHFLCAEFDIESESVIEVPGRGKKQFDFISVLAPSTETIIVCDFFNSRAIMLDKQFIALDTFQLPAKVVTADLLKGQLIATCHKKRGRIYLLEYSPTFKTIRAFDTQYLAMCVQSVDDTNVLVSMCDSIGHWHLHILSNTGQLIKKLKLNRTILDGYSLNVLFSDSFRFGYRILQCCEESDALYCFEEDGNDIFKFNVHSPNCVAVHDSGYIFLVDNFNHLHVLSPSGERLYKTKCCTNVTSVAITPLMDKLLLAKYKDNKITVMSVASKLNLVS